jgi:hypothetical protein
MYDGRPMLMLSTVVSAYRVRLAATAIALAVMLALGCARHSDLVIGDTPDSDLAGMVDSDAARQLLAELLARRSSHARLAAGTTPDTRLARLGVEGESVQISRLPDQARLRELGREVSMDFGALVFAKALGADSKSQAVQAAFDRFLREGPDRSSEALQRPSAFPYTLVFAPSWLYKSHPETGSDFALERGLVTRLGIPNSLIASGQSDSVEANAAVIADTLRTIGCSSGPIVVVSASKSGAEAALALTGLTPAESTCVVAWINIAGALGGTPLADAALRPPAKWLARGIFWVSGWSWDALESLATGPSRRRLDGRRMPETITVLNIVAVPVSGSVGYQVYGGYQVLGSHGPNDGVVLLADTVWPNSINLVALGADHLFFRWREDAYVLALLRAVDVAVRRYGPTPEPTVASDRDPAD